MKNKRRIEIHKKKLASKDGSKLGIWNLMARIQLLNILKIIL